MGTSFTGQNPASSTVAAQALLKLVAGEKSRFRLGSYSN